MQISCTLTNSLSLYVSHTCRCVTQPCHIHSREGTERGVQKRLSGLFLSLSASRLGDGAAASGASCSDLLLSHFPVLPLSLSAFLHNGNNKKKTIYNRRVLRHPATGRVHYLSTFHDPSWDWRHLIDKTLLLTKNNVPAVWRQSTNKFHPHHSLLTSTEWLCLTFPSASKQQQNNPKKQPCRDFCASDGVKKPIVFICSQSEKQKRGR